MTKLETVIVVLRLVGSRVLWSGAALGAMVGGVQATIAILFANGAPQQAAGAAMGCVFAIVPYIVARAWDQVTAPASFTQ